MIFHAFGVLPYLDRVPVGFANGYHRRRRRVAVVRLLFRFILGREVKNVASRIKHSRRWSGSQRVSMIMLDVGWAWSCMPSWFGVVSLWLLLLLFRGGAGVSHCFSNQLQVGRGVHVCF